MNCFRTLAAAAALYFAVSIPGPAHAAPQGEDNFKATYIRANIVKGKTTTEEVIARFGEPTSQRMDDSSETWVYLRRAPTPQRKKGAGLGAFMGLVKGVAATAYELAPDKVGGSATRLYAGADRAERTANAAASLGGGPAGATDTPQDAGPSMLQVSFSNGVVSSFSLR